MLYFFKISDAFKDSFRMAPDPINLTDGLSEVFILSRCCLDFLTLYFAGSGRAIHYSMDPNRCAPRLLLI